MASLLAAVQQREAGGGVQTGGGVRHGGRAQVRRLLSPRRRLHRRSLLARRAHRRLRALPLSGEALRNDIFGRACFRRLVARRGTFWSINRGVFQATVGQF